MKRLGTTCLIILAMSGTCSWMSFSQVKWAQTGFNFLNVSSDAKAGAMGDAVNSLPGYSGALFHNPAAMADMPNFLNSTFSINQWIADIKYISFSTIVAPLSGRYGVVGVSLQSVDYGDVLGTMVWHNEKGFIDTEILKPGALAAGIGYAYMVSDQFGVGTQVKFTYQSLGKSVVPLGGTLVTKQNVASALAYDFGTIYKTGFKSLAFGMSVRNFSKEVKFEEEGFQLPLLFTVGISANLLDFVPMPGPEQSFIISLDVTHPRSHPEQLKMGAEYVFMKILALRGGYTTGNSEDALTFGLGVSSAGTGVSSVGVEVDYSYTPFGVFDNVQRITARVSL